MEIYVMDREINILGVISVYESVMWTEKLHEPGNFKAVFVFTEKMNKILNRGNLLYKSDEEQPAIITRKYIKLNKYGEQTIIIQGYMASRYLNQRIIWKKMIMREMVEEQVINPEDGCRKMPLIELDDFKGHAGDTIEKQVTYDNLQEALTELSKTSGLGYRLRLDCRRKKLVFEVHKGKDRTFGTEKPCIFAREYGNIFTQEYFEDSSNYRNVCMVGGPGEDSERVLVVAGDASAAGVDRYEFFYNASAYSEEGVEREKLNLQLRQKGEEKLAAYYIAKSFESKINKKKAMDFALGDYVTCMDREWNVAVNTQVKEIQKGFSRTEESYIATFGDNVPTIVELIKAAKE